MRFRVADLTSPSLALQLFDHGWRASRLTVSSVHGRDLASLGVFGVAFYFAYRFGMSFSQVAASPFWFPDSVLLCALLMIRPRLWWAVVLLPLPIRLFSDVSDGIATWFLLATYAIDTAKGLTAAALLRRFVGDRFHFDSIKELLVFFVFAVLLVPAAFSFLGAAARSALGHGYWVSWEQWYLGNALTQLIVTPAVLVWARWPLWPEKLPSKQRSIEAAVLSVCLLITAYATTNTGPSSIDFAGARFYLPIPFMFWAAIRFGMRGATAATTVTAVLAVHGALQGVGPFANLLPSDITLALQNFLFLRAAPLYLVATVISQKEQVELRLHETEDRFRDMANTAPVLLWACDRDMRCEFVNQGWLDFTGRSTKEVTGEGWLQDVHPDDVQHMLDCLHVAVCDRQPFEVEYRLRRRDGEYRWMVHKGALRHGPDGDLLGYIGSAIDMTDRRQTEERARALSHAQRLVVMGELSAAIAHEVRQPLTAILSNADTAASLLNAQNPPLGEIREIIADIREDDLRANEVVGRIREFLRSHSERREPVDVNSVVADAIRFVSFDARRRRVQVKADLEESLPQISADPTQLQQVLINLLVNAMDAMATTPEAERLLSVQTRATGDHVEISVADRGCGIATSDLPRLFEPFFTTKSEGMGLGLSIVHSIVAAHQGQLHAQTNGEGGATFRVALPVS